MHGQVGTIMRNRKGMVHERYRQVVTPIGQEG